MEGFVLYCTERRIWNDVLIASFIILMLHVHATKLLDLSRCQQLGAQGTWPGPEFDYPCYGSLLSKALSVIGNINKLWQGILRLRGPEVYLLFCAIMTLSWVAVATASIHSSAIKRFYASGARLALLVGTKFACKAVSIVSLALWKDAPPSTFCKWYMPMDGAVLLWQAHVAPVGSATQANIAAADAACTFVCCWLLSDRWPYNLSTGTVLAVNLLLASASLWLAERVEQSDRRAFKTSGGARPLDNAGKNSSDAVEATGESTGCVVPEAEAGASKCNVVCCGCGCGLSRSAVSGTDVVACGGGRVTVGSQSVSAGPSSTIPVPKTMDLSPEHHRSDEIRCSSDGCSCLAEKPVTRRGGSGACVMKGGGVTADSISAAAAASSCCGGSTCASAGGGMVCSEVSSPATLSSTRSLSRALPSFSTLSNFSTFGVACGGNSSSAAALTETSGCSRSASRPSSCIGASLAGRAAGQEHSSQQAAPRRTLAAVVGVGTIMNAVCDNGIAKTNSSAAMTTTSASPSISLTRTSMPADAAVHTNNGEAPSDGAASASVSVSFVVSGLLMSSPQSARVADDELQFGRATSGRQLVSTAARTAELDSSLVVRAVSEPDTSERGASLLGRTSDGIEACSRDHHEGGSTAARGNTPLTLFLREQNGCVAITVAERVAKHAHVGSDPLRQLRRLVQNIVTRGGGAKTAAFAAAGAATVQLTTGQQTSLKKAGSIGQSVSGILTTSIPVSYSSSPSRSSMPFLCSDESQEGTIATVQAIALCDRSSATHIRAAGVPMAELVQGRAELFSTTVGAAIVGDTSDAAMGGKGICSMPTSLPTLAPMTASKDSVSIPNHFLVSADSVLAHPQPPAVGANALLHPQQRRQPPQVAMGSSALSADSVTPAPQQQTVQPQTPPCGASVPTSAAVPSTPSALSSSEASVVLASGKQGPVPLGANPAIPQASRARASHVPRPGVVANASWFGGGGSNATTASLGTGYSPCSRPSDDLRVPRGFAVARALAACGGSNAVYDTPALHHTRCSIKLEGVTPSELPFGFAGRVASLLAAGGSSAAEYPAGALAALAAVGVYVREGCVEVVADVLVPSSAAATESLVVAVTADMATNARGVGAVGTNSSALARVLAATEDTARTEALLPGLPTEQQAPRESATTDRAAAEAMLDFLERSLVPQIQASLPPPVSEAPLSVQGSVGMQATVGTAHVEAQLVLQGEAATAVTRLPYARSLPPTIVCVTPCCVPLVQSTIDDTRDCRRQTLTLTVALAGLDGGARLPRVFVRHSGRCLAATVRLCALPYVGCPTVTVEIARSGIRPGILFLEVAAANEDAPEVASLSPPWPVLVVGDARVVAEVMQLQQQLEASVPLRALQAEAEVVQLRQRDRSIPSGRQQLDGGATSLLVDFGMWFEAVSMPDTALIAAATGHTLVNSRVGAMAEPAELGTVAVQPLSQMAIETELLMSAAAAQQESEKERCARREGSWVAGQEQGEEEAFEAAGDDSSWASSEDQFLAVEAKDDDSVAASKELPSSRAVRGHGRPLNRTPNHLSGASGASASPGGQHNFLIVEADGTSSADIDGEVQMLLLRGLQPEQELLDGSLDCAVEYEETCRQGPALQSAAADLGIRLLRFAVLRGWPASASLLLKGLMVHCRLGFNDVHMLFPAMIDDAAGSTGAGMPLLHTAVMSGSLAMVRTVKAWGQRYRCSLPWDEPVVAAGGLTPLHLAAIQDGGRLAGAILGLWPDAEAQWAVVRDRDGRTPQEYACLRAMSGSSGASVPSLVPSSLGKSPVTIAGPPAAPSAPQQQHGPGDMRARPFQTQDWWIGQELIAEECPPMQQGPVRVPPPLLPPPQQAPRQTELTASEDIAHLCRSYIVEIAPQVPQPSFLPSTALQGQEAGPCESGAGVGTATVRGEDPGSNASSAFMTTMVPGIQCRGSTFGRLERTSDCGSMSMGPDSQWSHSTNATAQTQYMHQPTGPLQDVRGLSPMKPAGVHHAISAALLSLANLPDMDSNNGAPGGGGGSYASGGTRAPDATGASPFLSKAVELRGQLRMLMAAQVQQLQPAPDQPVRASFQLDLADPKLPPSSVGVPAQQTQQHSLLRKPPQQPQPSQHTISGPHALPVPSQKSATQLQQLQEACSGLPGSSFRMDGGLPELGSNTVMPGLCAQDSAPLVSSGTGPFAAGTGAKAVPNTDPAKAVSSTTDAASSLPPPAQPNAVPVPLSYAVAAKTPQSQVQLERKKLTPATPLTPSPLTSRGVRLLVTTILGDSRVSLRPRSPAGSAKSPSSAAAATSASGVDKSFSTQSTMGSTPSTLSQLTPNTRRVCSSDGRFSANTRRVGFADDYAPACLPTVAARTSSLTRLLQILAVRRTADGIIEHTDVTRKTATMAVLRLQLQQRATEALIAHGLKTDPCTGKTRDPTGDGSGAATIVHGGGSENLSNDYCRQLHVEITDAAPESFLDGELRRRRWSASQADPHIQERGHERFLKLEAKEVCEVLPATDLRPTEPTEAQVTTKVAWPGHGQRDDVTNVASVRAAPQPSILAPPQLLPLSLLVTGVLVLLMGVVLVVLPTLHKMPSARRG